MQKDRGLTLIEVLISITILIIIFLVALPTLNDFKKNQALNNTANDVVSLLNDARAKSLAKEGGNHFNVFFEPHRVVLSSGSVFVPDDPYSKEVFFDNIVNLPVSNVLINGSSDTIIFEKLTGDTDNYGIITLELISDPSKIKVITIHKTGFIDLN